MGLGWIAQRKNVIPISWVYKMKTMVSNSRSRQWYKKFDAFHINLKGVHFAWSLILSSCLMCRNASQPKLYRWSYEADLLDKTSLEMPAFNAVCEDLLHIWLLLDVLSTKAMREISVDSTYLTLTWFFILSLSRAIKRRPFYYLPLYTM